jgi:hypothetical protein
MVKAHLMREFTAIDGSECASAAWARQNLGADDEQISKAMTDIYSEATAAFTDAPDNGARLVSRMRLEGAVRELWGCADAQTKSFLVEIAADKGKNSWLRRVAVSSSLKAADAEEAKAVLLRFLVGEDRMDAMARSSICQHAWTAFMDADAGKKAAILGSLYVSLSREENKWLFRVYDDILCELSGDYAGSRQRLAILQRLIDAPSLCLSDDYAMPDLHAKLKVLQKTRPRTNINTNLAALAARDFNLPQPEELPTGGAFETTPEEPDTAAAVPPPRFWFAVPLAVGAGLLAALLLWRGLRKRT